MSRPLDLLLLRTFVAVADHAGMTAAARALHLTQGAVSQQVKRLEETVGHVLLDRTPRALRPTLAGERLLDAARRMLALNDQAWAGMGAAGAGARVRLGLPHDLAGAALAPLLRAFAERCPDAELSLQTAASPDILAAVERGEVDLALTEHRPDARPATPGHAEQLRVDRLVWVGAPAGRAHLRQPLPLSLVAGPCAFRPAVLAALAAHGRAWRSVFEAGSPNASAVAVAADLAVTAFLACAVPPGLRPLPAAAGLPALPAFAVSLHRRRGLDGDAAAMLAEILRGGFAPKPRSASPGASARGAAAPAARRPA